MTEHLLIATAGHVDHGKSTLVRSLTGMDPDRWQEEKARGITIDLGYAHRHEAQRHYSFVDVPGHERFIHNMLAGIGCIDGVLFVIAADESIMPQTREHALALHFLGCTQVGFVITKCDLVDEDLLELVHAELDDWLPQFGWDSAPRANFSSQNPASLQPILEMLQTFKSQTRAGQSLFRMPIDRVFVSQGSGTIATGSVDRGAVEKGEKVLLQPGDSASRIRQIQVHGSAAEHAYQHQRAALNLSDLHHSQLRRGHVLLQPPGALPSSHILVRLTLFEDWQPGTKHAFHLHHFSQHLMARLVWREDAYAMLRLNQPHVFWALDKGLVRDGSPLRVLAGFQIVHPAPKTTRRKRLSHLIHALGSAETADAWQASFLAQSQGVLRRDHLAQLVGKPMPPALEADLVTFDAQQIMHREVFTKLAEQCLAVLEQCHTERSRYDFLPLNWVRSRWEEAGIPPVMHDSALAYWGKKGRITAFEDRIKARDHHPTWQPQEKTQLKHILERCAQVPPVVDLREFQTERKQMEALIQLLVWEKFLVALTPELYLPSAYLNQVTAQLADEFTTKHLQVGDLKERLQLSRKLAIPMLELFDKLGLTVREQAGRRWLQASPPALVCDWQPPKI